MGLAIFVPDKLSISETPHSKIAYEVTFDSGLGPHNEHLPEHPEHDVNGTLPSSAMLDRTSMSSMLNGGS